MAEGVNLGTLWAVAQGVAAGGMSFANAWAAIQDSGLPVTREVFGQVYSLASQSLQAGRNLQAGGPEYVPTADSIVNSPLFYNDNYAYKVEVEGTMLGTNETGSVFVTVGSSSPISVSDALTSAVATVIDNAEKYGIDPTGALVHSVERSAWDWAGISYEKLTF